MTPSVSVRHTCGSPTMPTLTTTLLSWLSAENSSGRDMVGAASGESAWRLLRERETETEGVRRRAGRRYGVCVRSTASEREWAMR